MWESSKSRFSLKLNLLPWMMTSMEDFWHSLFSTQLVETILHNTMYLLSPWLWISSQTNMVEKRSHFTTLKSQKEPWNYLAGLRLPGSGWQAARLWRETALFYLRDSSESCQEFHQVTGRRQSGPQRNPINRWVDSFSSAADPWFPSGVVTRPRYRVDSDPVWKFNTASGWSKHKNLKNLVPLSPRTFVSLFNSKQCATRLVVYPTVQLNHQCTLCLICASVFCSEALLSLQAAPSIVCTHLNLFNRATSKTHCLCFNTGWQISSGWTPVLQPSVWFETTFRWATSGATCCFWQCCCAHNWDFQEQRSSFFFFFLCLHFERTSMCIFQKVNPRPPQTICSLLGS